MDEARLAIGPDSKGHTAICGAERLISCGPSVAEAAKDLRIVECDDAAIASPFANAHTHLYSGLVPLGMPDPQPAPRCFTEILERVWWKLDRALDERTLRASARYYVAHALLQGTSALIDHHESPEFIEGSLDVLADACEELGLRAVLCYGATERNGGLEEGKRGLAECRRFLESNKRSLVRGVVGLHASFTVSDETIRAAGNLAREFDTVLHVHVAEDIADVADAQKRGYPGPLERLLALGALVPRSILAHGVHLSEAQVAVAQEAECWFVQNPRSNAGNGVGFPHGFGNASRIALGTDGYPSHLDDEVKALFASAREHGVVTDDLWLRQQAGHWIFKERWDYAASGLVPGALSDLAVLRPDHSTEHLVVAGELVVENGTLVRGDLEEIDREAQEAAALLWQRMRAL